MLSFAVLDVGSFSYTSIAYIRYLVNKVKIYLDIVSNLCYSYYLMTTTQLYDSIHKLDTLHTHRETLGVRYPHEEKLAALQLFIDFYEGTDEESWCRGHFTEGEGKCCALGHLQITDPNTKEIQRKWAFLKHKVAEVSDLQIVHINDYAAPVEANPRTRVLAALRNRQRALRLGLNSCPSCGQAYTDETKEKYSWCDNCNKHVSILASAEHNES